ncbi:MAG: 5,6-dimethylbenzimidazole synthase [Candidatus Velthaea sp.]
MTHSAGFSATERAAVYHAIEARRDVRAHFVPDEVDPQALQRVLEAAHRAPSVGLSQPWRFIVVRDERTRADVHAAFVEANTVARRSYSGERQENYGRLRLEGILDAPLNICVLCDEDPARGHGLGRRTIPQTALYSTVCAIQNLWLAARVEGIGVGWVSILDPDRLRTILAVPPNLNVVAYLCVGYVSAFESEPDLVRAGWEARAPLADVVYNERYGVR